jgi:DNA-binding transcriptional LysR family regulator
MHNEAFGHIDNPMESPPRAGKTVSSTRRLRGRLRFRHLELLVTLGDVANLHKASSLLGMTQSAASKLLREIESMLGVRLFERSRTGLSANASGAAMVAHARLLLGMLDGARDDLEAIEAGATGLVRVGVSAVAAPVLLPRAARLLREANPGILLSVQEGGPELLADLRRGELDCVIGRIFEGDGNAHLIVERLCEEPIVAVVRSGHPLVRTRRRPEWPDVMTFDWVMPPPGAPIRRALHTWIARNGLHPPHVTFESVSVLTIITWVRESDAVATLPASVAAQWAELGWLRVLPLALKLSQPPVALMRRRPEATSVAATAFFEMLHIAARSHPASDVGDSEAAVPQDA